MTSDVPSTSLRSDARRNRERLLTAAEDVFREGGAAASLDDVARRAGVGIATLYRRFPTREALLAALCDDRLLRVAEASQARAETLNAPNALRVFMEELAGATATFRGLAASLGAVLAHPDRGCAATTREAQRLLDSAKGAGAVRHDVGTDDLLCIITAVALAVDQGKEASLRAPRLLDLFMNGLIRSAP